MVAGVSVTVLFSPEMYFGVLLKSRDFVTQMIAAYLIRVSTNYFHKINKLIIICSNLILL